MTNRTEILMGVALAEAEKAFCLGEVPVGAIITTADGQIIARGHNLNRSQQDCTAHAELLVLRQAGQLLQRQRLEGCSLYVTLEPCAMCAAAISFARIANLYFAALDSKQGAVFSGLQFFSSPNCFFSPNLHDGVLAEQSAQLIKQFFASLR